MIAMLILVTWGLGVVAKDGCAALANAQREELRREVAMYENTPLFQIQVDDALGRRLDARYPAIVAFLRANALLPNYSVLELGCAAGAMLRHVSEALRGMGGCGPLAGVELVPGWVQTARQILPDATIIEADMTELGSGAAVGLTRFDLVMLNDALEHVQTDRLACLFQSLAHMSRPETGAVYFHIPTPQTQVLEGRGGQFFENVVPYQAIINGMSEEGFQLERFELDRATECGSGENNTPSATLERSQRQGRAPATTAIGAHCTSRQGADDGGHPKYAHLLFRNEGSSSPSFHLTRQSAASADPPAGSTHQPRKSLSGEEKQLHEQGGGTELQGAAAIDRGEGMGLKATVDLSYKLHLPSGWYLQQGGAGINRQRGRHKNGTSYNSVMQALHGKNIWEDDQLQKQLDLLGVVGNVTPKGSPLPHGLLHHLISTTRPRLFLEVGVFLGSTSMGVAKMFESDRQFAHSFVLSMDTWLLDLRFVWPKKTQGTDPTYFGQNQVGGACMMYFNFLANVLKAQLSHRIIPLQTASSNGAMALFSHRIRPDLMYIDASHANPDVFIDYENFFNVLAPGGIMAVDDIAIVPACAVAFEALLKRYNLTATFHGNQAYVRKPVTIA